MYLLSRLIKRVVKESDDWIEYIKRYDKNAIDIHVSDDEFDFLMGLDNEYNYITYPNELYVDSHPTIIKENINNQEFINSYVNNLSDKFFVLYEYKKVE